jgi:stearoyl-CoA desaturase (delta-9 desaturase)
MNSEKDKVLNWTNIIFLVGTFLIAIIATPIYIMKHGITFWQGALFAFFYLATTMSITAGYHRYIAHRSHEASGWLKFLYLIFGAASFQGSALDWASDHRVHHRFVDTEKDPYNINKGFWYAHIGWLFVKDPNQTNERFAPDLLKDKMIMWQHNNFVLLAIFVSFFVPTIIGAFLGSAWGGFIFGGVTRLVIAQHGTFFINSMCHFWGTRNYNLNNTARDNFVLAFFTNGEGYHNFHHFFDADYRNGIRWYDWDPTKWWIKTLSFIGATKRLTITPKHRIFFARLEAQKQAFLKKGMAIDHIENAKVRIQHAFHRMQEQYVKYNQMKKELKDRTDARLIEIKNEYKKAKQDFKFAMQQWHALSYA